MRAKFLSFGKARFFSTSPSTLPTVMNSTFLRYPKTSVACIIGCEIASMFGTYTVLKFSPFATLISVDFALAFALSRVVRRVRLPVDLAAAALTVRVFPILQQIKISTLFPQPLSTGVFSRFAKVVDSYGLGYVIASRYSGVTSVLLIWAGLQEGVNVEAFLTDKIGISQESIESGGEVLGTWAASVCISSLLYPLSLFGGTYLARQAAKSLKF